MGKDFQDMSIGEQDGIPEEKLREIRNRVYFSATKEVKDVSCIADYILKKRAISKISDLLKYENVRNKLIREIENIIMMTI